MPQLRHRYGKVSDVKKPGAEKTTARKNRKMIARETLTRMDA